MPLKTTLCLLMCLLMCGCNRAEHARQEQLKNATHHRIAAIDSAVRSAVWKETGKRMEAGSVHYTFHNESGSDRQFFVEYHFPDNNPLPRLIRVYLTPQEDTFTSRWERIGR